MGICKGSRCGKSILCGMSWMRLTIENRFAPITVFTYAGAIGCLARDFILFLTTFFLATGSLFALIGWFLSSASAVTVLVKIAAYFWMVSSVLAMYWVASKVIKENWGKTSRGKDWLPIFETKIQRNKSEVHPAVNEPGVKHGQ